MFVYVMYNKYKEVLYVGKTSNMKYRMNQHFGVNRESWKDEVENIKYMDCINEVDMSMYEIYLINKLKPKHNKSLLYSGESNICLSYNLINYDLKENNNYDILTDEEKQNFKKLINIYQDKGKSKFNTNFEKMIDIKTKSNILSYRWSIENKEKYNKVIKNTHSYVRRTCTKTGVSTKNTAISIWSDFYNTDDDNIKRLKRSIIKNNLEEVTVLAYLKNDYIVKNENTKEINSYKSVLPLVKFIKNSDIVNGNEIHIYIPSKRMRDLLSRYLDGELKPEC